MSGNLVLFPGAKPRYTLDSWPVLEWLQNRRTADAFDVLIERAKRKEIVLVMSLINLGEVIYGSVKAKLPEPLDSVLARMQQLPITYVDVTEDLVYAAARLKAVHTIAYADAFAAALSIELDATLITGGPDFPPLAAAGIVRIEWWGK